MIESPHEKGVFYTGSDDGLVHVTRDNGKTWQNITPKNLGETLVNAIEISPHDPATVYIATTKYKFNDHTPALFKSTDYGITWSNINEGIPYGAFTRVVREDSNRKNLLYAGTEKGMYISLDGGSSWQTFQLNLPQTPITDLKVHQGNLIVATSGRSFWVLDDLSVLSQYDPEKQRGQEVKIFSPSPALNGTWRSPMSGDTEKFNGMTEFEGVNPANGMVIYYELPKTKDSTIISMDILNTNGKVIRQFSSEKDSTYKKHNGGGPPPAPTLPNKAGLNRFVWDLRYPIMPGIPNTYIEADFRGHVAPPGSYKINLKVGDETINATGKIITIPIYETEESQYETYDAFMTEMEQKLGVMHKRVNSLYTAQQHLKNVLEDVKDATLESEGQQLLKEMDMWDKEMIQRKTQAYDDVENFPNKFTAEYLFLINATNSEIPRVNQSSRDRKAELDAQWKALEKEADDLMKIAIPEFNVKLWEAGIGAIRF